ncbi:MAG: acyl-CoA dehydrogenase family protein [Gemmataceae bacterium]
MNDLPEDLRQVLSSRADDADRLCDWPALSWDALRTSGLLAAGVSSRYGGTEADPVRLLRRSESLAGACLTTAFILSQREAAVRHLLRGPEHLGQRYLPQLASGALFLTVGLSQLTTSRQHGQPALLATPQPGGGYRLEGEAPWVTGADQAAALVLGAVLPDGRQALFVVPTDRPGLSVGPPLPLAALAGSRTAAVRCAGVSVAGEDVLTQPADQVLGNVGGGGLDTSSLALGLAQAATDDLREESHHRPALGVVADRFDQALASARARLHLQAVSSEPEAVLALRAEATRLALTATQAGLLAVKGAGFIAPHPVERRLRQASFFLVWSCPRPVAEGVLSGLLPLSM